MSRLTIRVRLTLWYAGLLAVILAAFGTGVYLTVRATLYRNLDESIEARANTIIAGIAIEDGRPVLPLNPRTDDDDFVRVAAAGSPTADVESEMKVGRFPIVYEGETVGMLEVGQSRESVTEALSALLLTIGVAYPLTLVSLSSGVSFWQGGLSRRSTLLPRWRAGSPPRTWASGSTSNSPMTSWVV